MTNAHFHKGGYACFCRVGGRETPFYGIHPWAADAVADSAAALEAVRAVLEADPAAGVGEIGLDRLRSRETSAAQRALFAAQLALAAELGRPVALHGAKCWGEVVKACEPHRGKIPSFLFHGFSRSDGLLPAIAALNGFVSAGPAALNDHAVNYRAMLKKVPLDRLLVETDADEDAREEDVFAKVAELTGLSEARLDANARAFLDAKAVSA